MTTAYDAALPLGDTVVVSASQSGSTAEIVDTQRAARRDGAVTVAVTNTADSPLAREAHLALVTAAGPELAVPATKTFTTALLAMAVLVDSLSAPPVFAPGELAQLPGTVAATLAVAAEPVARIAAAVAPRGDDVVVTSRGIALAAALETALKLEESALEPVRGLSAADLQQGPAAVLGGSTTLVVLAPADGPVLAGLTATARAARSAGAHVVGVGGDSSFAAACHDHVPVPRVRESLAPFPLTCVGRLLALGVATARGLDPDTPPGLTKVTQTA